MWGTSVWGDGSVWGATGDKKGRVALRGVGSIFQPQFNSEDAFHLKTIVFGVQPTGRR